MLTSLGSDYKGPERSYTTDIFSEILVAICTTIGQHSKVARIANTLITNLIY